MEFTSIQNIFYGQVPRKKMAESIADGCNAKNPEPSIRTNGRLRVFSLCMITICDHAVQPAVLIWQALVPLLRLALLLAPFF